MMAYIPDNLPEDHPDVITGLDIWSEGYARGREEAFAEAIAAARQTQGMKSSVDAVVEAIEALRDQKAAK